jgi:hypothetical protein
MSHPYTRLPDHCFWRKAVSSLPARDVDPVVRGRFRISRRDRVATAGSCFAQHIARHLSQAGFNYFVTEEVNPIIEPELAAGYNYGVFTARYGNIYTARQFLQLLKRAYGLFAPADDLWLAELDGRAYDPYRPLIQPDGFASARECLADRAQHFAAVRRAVEESDVFVFTLGLTEAWMNIRDGAIYPLCPGTAAGVFDPAEHRFINFRMHQVLDDMRKAFDFMRHRNPRIRFIVTVSPVPLIATAVDQHVLVSSTYSKSVLRAACGELEAEYEDISYFPSFEIITGGFNRGAYYEADMREVREAGVEHVMRLFMRHYAAPGDLHGAASGAMPASPAGDAGTLAEALDTAAKVICDEYVLDRTHG